MSPTSTRTGIIEPEVLDYLSCESCREVFTARPNWEIARCPYCREDLRVISYQMWRVKLRAAIKRAKVQAVAAEWSGS